MKQLKIFEVIETKQNCGCDDDEMSINRPEKGGACAPGSLGGKLHHLKTQKVHAT